MTKPRSPLGVAFLFAVSGALGAEEPAPSLVSLSAGALVVVRPKEYNDHWSSLQIIDERSASGWATPQGILGDQTIVIEMPERTVLKALEFDTGSIDGEGRGAKDIAVSVSDTSSSEGFRAIADVSLKDRADGQKFPVKGEVPGRWVKLYVKNNHGSTEYVELFDFRATGTQMTHTPTPDVSGTYSTNYNDFHIRQEGTSVNGCYEWSDGILEGGIEGRVLRFTWKQSNGQGPAVLVVSRDRKQFIGLWWNAGDTGGAGGFWTGTRKSDAVGGCPNWSGGASARIVRNLEKEGRARLYDINFDPDSDHIRDESRPALDRVAALLKEHAGWTILVEGHTDSTSTPAHNQELSEKRARAVKAYLETVGIAPARLSTSGYGATKPLAGNDTALGRSQNRRVELVKKS